MSNFTSAVGRVRESQAVREKARQTALGFDLADIDGTNLPPLRKLAALRDRQMEFLRTQNVDRQQNHVEMRRAQDAARRADVMADNPEIDRARIAPDGAVVGLPPLAAAQDGGSGRPPPPMDPRAMVQQRGQMMEMNRPARMPARRSRTRTFDFAG